MEIRTHVVCNCWKAGASAATRPDRQAGADVKHTAHWLESLDCIQLMEVGGTDGLDVTWSDVSVQ